MTNDYARHSLAALREIRADLADREARTIAQGEGKRGEAFRDVIRKGTDLRRRRIAVETEIRDRGESL
jgi:hypothetical protein